MSESGASRSPPSQVPTNFFAALFRFKGRMSRGGYFAGLLVSLVVLALMFVVLVKASDPRGSGSADILLLPAIAGYLWIHSSLMVTRLRDAGLHGPLAILFVVGPVVWIGFALGVIPDEQAGMFMAGVGFLLFFVAPGLFRPKEQAAQDAAV